VAEHLVQHLIDNASATSPATTAVCAPAGDALTYADLDRLSSKLAHCLAANGVRRQDRVALCLRRTPKAVVAITGTLKADGVYVPIDPKSPSERQLQVIDDCRPSAVVCDGHTADVALGLARRSGLGIPTVCLDDAPAVGEATETPFVRRRDVDGYPDRRPLYRCVDVDLAYILYTSGSTGRPKGVMVTHRSVLDYARWAVEYFGISSEDRVLATAPFHFDMSTFDVFSALKGAARLCIVPEDLLLFPHRLLSYLEEEGVTIWKTVPSLFVYMARTGCLKPGRMPTLTRMLFGGEVLHPKDLALWMSLYPEKAFYNVYGPTEATGVSLCHAVTSAPEDGQIRVPIGTPCANTEAFVLRADGTPAGSGEPGELYIRGAGVASGYWSDSGKTRAAFVDNPLAPDRGDRVYRTGDLVLQREDGSFEFLGRNDEQVKYMGYRIVTSDIEAALVSLPGVNEAAVFLDEAEKLVAPELVALVQCEPDRDPAEIVKELRLRLPHYMVPKRIIPVASLPRTDRGKIAMQDVRRLAAGRSS
jgi:amino acid adenylation domain-containing protein